ncbi:MAG: hypothetical protein U1E05_18210 [Patescibacteria group bacterium]|nr:hypothetical protein [Patescibacteria group bacterium]
MGWLSDPERVQSLGAALRLIARLNRSILAVPLRGPEETDNEADPWEAPPGSIDVWWRGMKNGELMLMLAHLLQQNPAWRNRPIRLLRAIGSEAGWAEVLRNWPTLPTRHAFRWIRPRPGRRTPCVRARKRKNRNQPVPPPRAAPREQTEN